MRNALQLRSTARVRWAILFLATTTVASGSFAQTASDSANKSDETLYLTQIRSDFLQHKHNVTVVGSIGGGIVARIDSLFSGSRPDTTNADLIEQIMITQAYDMTILAYKDILNGRYVGDARLKLAIARHVAWFEGIAASKRHWDNQWDETARPYIYNNGLFKSRKARYNLIADPVFRSVLFDRRMFAHDAEAVTPRILASADSIIGAIDLLLKK